MSFVNKSDNDVIVIYSIRVWYYSNMYVLGTLKSEMTLFASTGESLEWDMRKTFFTGSDLDYSLS